MEYTIEAEGLRKRFGETQALDGVDLAARRGSVLGVLGPNGAGKTTAVRILATLIAARRGHARSPATTSPASPPRCARRSDSPASTRRWTSADRRAEPGHDRPAARPAGPRARARARELLTWFDLAEAADRPAKTYSGGMRRRLDLAASLVGRPSVIFLDEPTTGLDPSKREDMWEVVRASWTTARPCC